MLIAAFLSTILIVMAMEIANGTGSFNVEWPHYTDKVVNIDANQTA